MGGQLRDRALAWITVVLCAFVAVITISGSVSRFAWVDAAARAAMVGAPIAVGIYARRRPPFERFGRLLIVSGLGWSLTTLSGAGNEVLYSIGRVSGWVVEVWLAYVVLAFPSGRLEHPADRALVFCSALLVATLYLPTALLVEHYPVPTPWATCSTGCPSNAFAVVSPEPAFVENVVRPVREALTLALFVGVVARLGHRLAGATRVMQRALAAVLAAAIFRLVAYTAAIVGRQIAPESLFVDVAAWLVALGVPIMACALLAGLMSWRLFIAAAVQRLAARVGGHPRPDDLRAALADAFDDPSLEILYWLGNGAGHWADAAGRPVVPPSLESGRCLTEVRDGDRTVAGIVHDVALRDDRAFIDSATSYAVMALDNHRLAARAASLLREVHESRARIQATADDERRRIERDLHDGAQQRLVALRIKVELAAERIYGRDPHSADLLQGIGIEVDEALDEVRSLARGIYPAPLADRGLVEALRAAALRTAVPTTVRAAHIPRYPREIESAAYFCCLEAVQNAAKHARGATKVLVELSCADGALHFEVRDDGAGFDPDATAPGVGVTSMRDRLAAVGGDVAIESRPNRGTTVRGDIPCGVGAAPRGKEECR